MSDAGGVRIGDAERQAVVDMLRRHTGEGRLTLDEFAERAGEVYAARTREELDKVLVDLPEGVRPAPPASATSPVPVDAPVPARADPAPPSHPQPHAAARRGGTPRRRFVAIMSGSEARGAWRAPAEISAFAFWGGVDIDLRNALIESPVVEIEAWAVMGAVDVIVPPGIPVDIDGFILMGGITNKIRDEEPPIPGAPLIRIKARGMWGGVTVRNPRKKRLRDVGRDLRRELRDELRQSHSRHHHSSRRHRPDPDEMIERVRSAIDRALPPPSTSDRIPEMPTEQRQPVARPQPVTRPVPGEPQAQAPLAAPGSAPEADPKPEPTDDPATRIPTGTLTILVSDIAGSTQMTERLGDQTWFEVLAAHNAIVRQKVADHGGTEVKAQGDGFLVVFPSARSAVLAAISIQQAMVEYDTEHLDAPVELRVGLHTGEVVSVEGDVFGQNVVAASRIAAAALPGEIFVSGLTHDLTSSASDIGFEPGKEIDLKGMSQPWRVHRVIWT
jgi:class 3 adenylate cyclase